MSKKVRLYSSVTVKSKNWSGEYIIVRPREGNIFENKISSQSPLGKNLLGQKEKTIIKIQTPQGPVGCKIVKIRNGSQTTG